jgi:hypothetical protein
MKAVLMFVALSGFGIGGPSQRMHQARAPRNVYLVSPSGLDGLVGIGRFLAPSSFSSFQS